MTAGPVPYVYGRYLRSTRSNRHPLRKLPGSRRRSHIDKRESPARAGVGMTWGAVTEGMTIRSGHYSALLETIDARGATKLHVDEREQLLGVADALLFGDPDSKHALARGLELIARLRDSERWSAQTCAQLRAHLCGCGPLPTKA